MHERRDNLHRQGLLHQIHKTNSHPKANTAGGDKVKNMKGINNDLDRKNQ